MKTVKILSLTLLMSILFAGTSFAQQRGQRDQQARPTSETRATPEERAARRVEMMKESLNLTPDQVTKIQALQTQRAKDQQNAHKDMQAKREAYDAQLKSILTPEQYQKLQEQRKDMRSGGKQGKGNRGGQQSKSGKGNHQGKPAQKQGCSK